MNVKKVILLGLFTLGSFYILETDKESHNVGKTQKTKSQATFNGNNKKVGSDIRRSKGNNKVNPLKLRTAKERLGYYFNCLEYQQCQNIPSDDPRMYEFEVGKKIENELRQLIHKKIISEDEKEFIYKSMNTFNGHVQAVALKYFERSPLNEENLDIVLSGLKISEFDIVLMAKAKPLLDRYFREAETQSMVFEYVTGQIQEGSYLSAEYFAKNIGDFLDYKNVEELQDIIRQETAMKHTNKYLESAIENFKLLQSGG